MNSNNGTGLNTGLAQKIEQFNFSQSQSGLNQPKVLGVKYSAPDFSIPPTPASSYQNIRVVLDTVHESSVTYKSQTLSGGSEVLGVRSQQAPVPSYNMGQNMGANSSFSSLPSNTTSFSDNRLDSIPARSDRAVIDMVDAEQPLARSNEALTSLKSEIAPISYPMVQLEEMDELAERTDRALPPAVNIALVDEDASYFSASYPSKQWALMEEEERSWRMGRSVDQAWLSSWKSVGQELLGGSLDNSSSSLNLDQLEEQERQWRMSRPIDSTWSGKWAQVSREARSYNSVLDNLSEWASDVKEGLQREVNELLGNINTATTELSKMEIRTPSLDLDALEEAERQWRMSRGVDSLWQSSMSLVQQELSGGLESWTEIASAGLTWSQLELLESEERLYRVAKGVDAVLYGKWHQIGLELKDVIGLSWSEWFTNIKNRASFATSRAAHATSQAAHNAAETLSHVQLPSVSLPTLPSVTLPTVTLPDLKIGVVKSEAVMPMYYDSEIVDFSFKNSRTPFDIIELEEQERLYRMSIGVNPIVAGMFYRVGLELKYKYSLRPTIAGVASEVATTIAENASSFAERVVDTVESFVDSAVSTAQDTFATQESIEFSGKHLNLFAYSSEPIDFTFTKTRTPAYILALEEQARVERAEIYDRVLHSQWNRFLIDNLPATFDADLAEGVIMHAVHQAESLVGATAHIVADKASGFTGFFSHMLDSAKETLHIGEQKIAVVSESLSEEAERQRLINAKVDPMAAAKKGRVQDELLQFTVKSV